LKVFCSYLFCILSSKQALRQPLSFAHASGLTFNYDMEEEITARVVGAVAESESHGKLLRFVLLF